MAYKLEGSLLEVCNCEVLCPCWIGVDPDNGFVTLLWPIILTGDKLMASIIRPYHGLHRPHPRKRAER